MARKYALTTISIVWDNKQVSAVYSDYPMTPVNSFAELQQFVKDNHINSAHVQLKIINEE